MPNYFVRCRCGERHVMATTTSPCSMCDTPTFDAHGVCARCRGAEAVAQQQARLRKSLVRR